MNSPEQIGVVIKNARTNKHLTQKELAEKLFVEPTAVSRWECGRGYPSPQLMEAICGCLEITLFELLGEDSDIGIRKAFRNKKISIAKIVISFLEAAILPLFFIYSKYNGNFYCFDEESIWNPVNVFAVSSITFLVISIVFNIIDCINGLKNDCKKMLSIFGIISLVISMAFVVACVFINNWSIFYSIIGICSNFVFLFLFILYKIANYKRATTVSFAIDILVAVFFWYSFYICGLNISLSTRANILIVFYYIVGVIPNVFPFIYLLIKFRKKTIWLILLAVAIAILNAIFIIQFYSNVFYSIYEIIVYIGMLTSSFGILITDEILKGVIRYDY